MELEPCLPTIPSGTKEICLQGDGFELLALSDRALWWPLQKILLISDLHFGKGARGDRSPLIAESIADEMLSRLSLLLNQYSPESVVVLGDWIDAKPVSMDRIADSISAWRKTYSQISIQLILGNHDQADDERWDRWRIEWYHGPKIIEPFELIHNPRDSCEQPSKGSVDRYRISGHLHPSIRTASGRCVPCFWSLPNLLVLPAFHPELKWYPVSSSASGYFFPVENNAFVEFRRLDDLRSKKTSKETNRIAHDEE